jgi:histidinol-phosphatase (PHP family)
MWSNYHTHSKYCDGKDELIDYVSMARQKNIKSLGFSSHAPVPFDCKWCMQKDKLAAYLEQIDTLKNSHQDIELYKSLEIDFIPGVISPFEFKDELDYTIGSIHFIDKLPDNTPWEIDGTHAIFKEGYEKIFNSNIRDVLVRYFELTREMIYASDPTIIGHLDKIKIQNIDGKYFNETDQWYKDEVLKTLKLIEQAESIVEVNTRGIYQKKTSTTYPSPWILEIIRDKNIPITISSDAHHPDDLTNQFEQTSELLLKMKFKKLSMLSEGKWKQLPFDNHGIIF